MAKKYFLLLTCCLFGLVSYAQEAKERPVAFGTEKNIAREIAELKIFPNPITNGKAFITTKKNHKKVVLIFDVFGKSVLKTLLHSSELDVSRLKPGIYIIKITEDKITSSRKLVIK